MGRLCQNSKYQYCVLLGFHCNVLNSEPAVEAEFALMNLNESVLLLEENHHNRVEEVSQNTSFQQPVSFLLVSCSMSEWAFWSGVSNEVYL